MREQPSPFTFSRVVCVMIAVATAFALMSVFFWVPPAQIKDLIFPDMYIVPVILWGVLCGVLYEIFWSHHRRAVECASVMAVLGFYSFQHMVQSALILFVIFAVLILEIGLTILSRK